MKTAEQIDNYFKKVMSNTYKSKFDIDDNHNLLKKIKDSKQTHAAEGIVISLGNKKYESGTSNSKIKYKAKYENDAVVIEPHPTKASIKVYRKDCEPFSAVFYISTEGRPKSFFKKNDIIKYTCLGFTKGDSGCPGIPKMAKFKDLRTEELRPDSKSKSKNKEKSKKKKLPPAPKDGPNEHFAKYFDAIAKNYFDKKDTFRGISYRKNAAILRRHTDKLNSIEECKDLLGSGSFGKQCQCFVKEHSINKDWMKKCAEGRL